MAGVQYKCPACGGPISFDPRSGTMTCGHCASEFTVAAVEQFNAAPPPPPPPPPGPGPQQGLPPRQGFADLLPPSANAFFDRSMQTIPGLPGMPPGPAPVRAEDGDVVKQGSPAPPPPRQQPQTGFTWDVQVPEELTADEAREQGLLHLECPSCGGGIIGAPDTVSTKCPYCDNNFVAESQLRDTIVPTRLIPFSTTKDEVIEQFRARAKELPLIPNVFTDEATTAELAGIYVPYWLYGCDVHADVQFDAVSTLTTTSGDEETTTTSHYAVRRAGYMGFNAIPVAATQIIDDDRTESIEPFDLDGAKPFGTAYLAGFRANTCTVSAEDAHPRAWQRIEASVIGAMRDTVVGYSSVDVSGSDIRLLRGGTELMYLPVWMLNVDYAGRTWTYAMNGQTGRLVGEFPVSRAKKWSAFAGVAVPLFLIIFLILWLVFLS
ncbi:hypothetical protein [Corynebacterium sp.]|uniref:hypothetical protein n=1 Tax=Corynebacterium sp. TaxID=1720 RepID=UPI0025BCCDE7|nr:hypothetical protein [Corynebacterium sp.]